MTTQTKTPVSEEAFNLLCCIRPIIKDGQIVETKGLEEFEKRLNELLNKNKTPSQDNQEVCIIENELLGLRLTLGSRIYPVCELQRQGLDTLKKMIKDTPTRIPLGIN